MKAKTFKKKVNESKNLQNKETVNERNENLQNKEKVNESTNHQTMNHSHIKFRPTNFDKHRKYRPSIKNTQSQIV